MSGRRDWPSDWLVTCRSKSQRSTMPAISATFLSWVSPHEPRTCGLRSAVTSEAVSRRSDSPVSRTERTWAWRSVAMATRSFSTSVRRAWNFSRLAETGARSCSVAWSRCAVTVSTDLPCRSATSAESTLNWSIMVCRSAAISWARARAASRWAIAPATSASVCAALVRASAASVRASAASARATASSSRARPSSRSSRPEESARLSQAPTHSPTTSVRSTRSSIGTVMRASSPMAPTQPG